MGGDDKFSEGKVKLIVRSYSEPVLFTFYDKFGQNWTTFSPIEVERFRKKLTSCSTEHIEDNETHCRSLPVEGMFMVFNCLNNMKEIQEYVFRIVTSARQRKHSKSPWGLRIFFFVLPS